MDIYSFKSIYNEILNSLLNKDFLNKLSLSDEFIRKHIYSSSFIDNVNQIVTEQKYSCRDVLNLCMDIMEELIEGEIYEDWLYHIYQFALNKSFPDAVHLDFSENFRKACLIYLEVLRVISRFQKISEDGTWQSRYPLNFLTDEEEKELENRYEYRIFRRAFYDEYIYEMMKLNQEVMGYSTLDHICGVHYLALFIGRQLKNAAGLPVDLGRVSGAAAGHDIGKFGCKGEELKRVPYLHYYYTDEWFKKHDIVYIRNIAINHSTWDLELENLSLESLILIYCDFRVKNKKTENRKSHMHIYSLQEAFEVVLNKLDNVDKAKEMRYKRVYAKLKDFEEFMIDRGINVDVEKSDKNNYHRTNRKKYYSLMQGNRVIENLKYLSIEHNINLMYKLRDESSLNVILEQARSETDLNNLRKYLNIFEEYSTYLTQKQKLITIKFLYELLIHPEDDIRKQCAELIGTLIAMFDEVYRKEVPENVILESPQLTSTQLLDKYFRFLIFPSKKIIPIHQMWIGSSTSTMISSIFSHCKENQINGFIEVLIKYYERDYEEDSIKLNLINTAKYIPISKCNEKAVGILFDYILMMFDDEQKDLRLTALETIYNLLLKEDIDSKYQELIKEQFIKEMYSSDFAAENYLKLKIAILLRMDDEVIKKLHSIYSEDTGKIQSMFLSNLKTATNWIVKKAQIELLLDYTLKNPESMGIHTAMHFCNLLKVSSVESIRNSAGEALIYLIPRLSLDQRNEIAIELLRALEIEGYQFTKYIPDYLGKLILYLQPVELDELLDDLINKIRQSSPQVTSLLLKTVGLAIANYYKYKNIFNEKRSIYNNRLIRMLGILLNGFANYNPKVKQVAFSVIGKDIFGSKYLELEQKNHIFQLIAKKILTILEDNKEDEELLFLTNAAALNHIYRFISDYKFYMGEINLKEEGKIAFFPGTFDPFSLSHKEIAKEIRDLGFEVYLSIDEFSWSKRTQPNLIRRNIIRMSIADELGIYLYPEDFQTNIANLEDLKRLKDNFPNSDVHIVVGSDVLLNASAYMGEREEFSVHSFPHIVFERRSHYSSAMYDTSVDEVIKNIKGEVIRLSLPLQYEDISSTQIRSYIDQNRDISKLVDPLVEKYIYEKGLYRREPQYKTLVQTKSISVEVVDKFDKELLEEISSIFINNRESVLVKLNEFTQKLNPRILILRNINKDREILGFSLFHWVRSSMLIKEFKDSAVTEYIRNNYIGRMIAIDGVFAGKDNDIEDLEQKILMETLAFCLSKDYTYCIFRNVIPEYQCDSVYETLILQGFEKVLYGDDNNPVFVVNMTAPCTLSLDIETIIKEPFKNNVNVKKAIRRARKRLQRAITKLYPGYLLLSFDRNMVYENMIKKICDENGVPTYPTNPRKLGPSMCVPFGSILNGCIIPNTITKSLHTDKLFSPNVKDYRIGAYPYYLDLENQVKMLRSFNRPIILVDDLLHKGYRIKAIVPLLKKENIEVKKIIVGILSGRGKELMDIQNREVDCAYFIPKLRLWFNESLMYPFIDGHTLWRGIYPKTNLIPSINLILPYTSPAFIKGTTKEAIYNLSKVSIENAIDILSTLEREYQKLNERSLTLVHLGEVFISPRCPDLGENISYDLNLNPCHYLRNDLNILKRLEHTICSE